MRTPETLLPHIDESGELQPQKEVFEVRQIEPESPEFKGLIPVREILTRHSEVILDDDELTQPHFQWVKEWVDQMDEWIDENGLFLPVPISVADASRGKTIAMLMRRKGPKDHVDNWKFMPAGRSIGIAGERDFSGVALPSVEVAHEAQHKLLRDNETLHDKEELIVNGVPYEVEKVRQRRGTVVDIGATSSIHTIRPVRYADQAGEPEPAEALVLGPRSRVAPDHDHIRQQFEKDHYIKATDPNTGESQLVSSWPLDANSYNYQEEDQDPASQ